MLKKPLSIVAAVVLSAVLLALPAVVRHFYYYEGTPYRAGAVARPDLSAVEAPSPDLPSFVDSPGDPAPGTILVDRAHANRFDMPELSILQSRLTARGRRVEAVTSADDLAGQLRSAQALVVIAPGKSWTAAEIRHAAEFVDRGGRLLLVTDPTRFEVLYDEEGYYLGIDYDTTHINDLAGEFGLVFQADYLYNTVENENNFRNIKLTDLADDELTSGVDEVVFYGTHSILSDRPALISAGGDTRSSTGERPGSLAVATLAAEGAVLGLGDATFLSEPNNAVAGNDRLIANLADWLGGAQRRYTLADFPFFFGQEADLVYGGDPALDSDLLAAGGRLQALFAAEGKALAVQKQEDPARDTLFLGLYREAAGLESYLAAAEVTLLLSPTVSSGDVAAADEVTATVALSVTGAVSPPAWQRIDIGTMGDTVLTGTCLLLLLGPPGGPGPAGGDDEAAAGAPRRVLVALSDTLTGLENAVERLADGDLEDCTLHESEPPTGTLLALCPTGEVGAGKGGGGWPSTSEDKPSTSEDKPSTSEDEPSADEDKQPEKPAGEGDREPQGALLVVALDAGDGRYDSLTGAAEFEAILDGRFKVTVWSEAEEGLPGPDDYAGCELVILAGGDYQGAFGDEASSLLMALMLDQVPVLISGAYVESGGGESVQRDIQVRDAEHPMAQGFTAGQVIAFVAAPSGSEYQVAILPAPDPGEGTEVPFVRGPGSDDEGAPAVMAMEDADNGIRVVFMGFPPYLLPGEARTRLVDNMVNWLIAEG